MDQKTRYYRIGAARTAVRVTAETLRRHFRENWPPSRRIETLILCDAKVKRHSPDYSWVLVDRTVLPLGALALDEEAVKAQFVEWLFCERSTGVPRREFPKKVMEVLYAIRIASSKVLGPVFSYAITTRIRRSKGGDEK